MKKIISTMALFGFTFQFLSAAQMYIKDDTDPQTFQTTADNFNDAYYTAGVTIMPFIEAEAESWKLGAEKLNPVIYLTTDKITEMGLAVPVGHYARETLDVAGDSSDWVKMVVNSEPDAQYQGPPLFMDFDAWSSESSDYKGDSFQNGEVALRFFPVLEMQRFTDDGGAIIESWYRKNDETSWTKFSTKVSGPNGHVITSVDLWGDLTDGNPVEITWDAKTDIPDFNGNISVRIRAKYGSAPFENAPAPYDGGSPTPSAQFLEDTNVPFNDFIDWDPAGGDSGIADLNADGSIDEKDKFLKVLQESSLNSVGTYDAAGTDLLVYDLDETAISKLTALAPSPGFFAFTGDKIIRVKEATPSGS